jgi:hypothetical protein
MGTRRTPSREPSTSFQPRTEYERVVMESAKAAVKLAYDAGYKDGRKGVRRPVMVDFRA